MQLQFQISIVVPFRNTKAYLAECLDSILSLPIEGLELILVNDGSTDGSADVAHRFAEAWGNVRCLETQSIGPGGARNVGIRASRGRYIGFVDSDDVVIAEGYKRAFDLLKSHDSDFVIFNFKRWNRGHLSISKIASGCADDGVELRLRDRPGLVYNRVLWNKIFRRDFCFREIYPLSHNVFEDLYPNTRAFCNSVKFDISAMIGLYWRVREDNNSITQDVTAAKNLVGRVEELKRCIGFLASESREYLPLYLAAIKDHDLHQLRRGLRGCTNKIARATVRQFIDSLAECDFMTGNPLIDQLG